MKALFDRKYSWLWRDYCDITPQVPIIHSSFHDRSEDVTKSDHVALRTLGLSKICKEAIAESFMNEFHYGVGGEYNSDDHFVEKKLNAIYLEHKSDPNQPKIFISELDLSKCSDFVRETAYSLYDQIDESVFKSRYVHSLCRPWEVSYETYKKLLEESEYAAWVAAFGIRVNHYTVSVNNLSTFDGIYELNDFLKEQGFELNSSGGEVKGSPEVLLEQSSTMASIVDVEFTDGVYQIPSCYYEFAHRYKDEKGKLFQGFLPKSANKIFESTNVEM